MAVISWKYNTDGSWSNAANWSGGALPGAADDVMLATLSYHTITHASGSDQIHNLTATTDSLAITGGTLSISGTASFARNLSVSTGTLSLQGTSASVAGTFIGTSGQILLGTGTSLSLQTSNFGTTNVYYGIEIDGQGTLTTLGTTSIAASYNDGVVLGNGVTWNIQGTVNDNGGIYIGDGFGLGATLKNAAGVSFNLTSDNANIVNGYLYNSHGQQVFGTSTFSNAGTLTKTAGTGTSHIYSVFTNTGVVTAASGTLEFDGGGSFAGTLSGAGTIAFGGGTATIGTGAGLSAGNLLVDGATASFTGPLTTTGTISLTAGSLTLDGSADSIAAFNQDGYYGDHLNLNGSTLSSGAAFLGSGYLEGPGTLSVTGTTTLSGWNNYTYYLGGGATLANAGTINQAYYTYVDYLSGAGFTILNKAGGAYNLTGDFSLGANNSNGIGSTFTNLGTFAKSGGTGISQVISVFNSTGIVNAASGTLEFDGGGTIGGSLTGTSVLAFASGAYTLSAGTSIKASEMLFDGATVTIGGNETYTAAQLVEVNGTILLGAHTIAATSAFLGGGAITGPGTITTAGTTTLSGNNGGGVLYLGGGVNLVNSGIVNQAYYLYVNPPTGAGFTITNKAGATYNLTGNFNIGGNSYNGIGSSFINAGTFAKTAGTGTTNVYSAFTNTGVITSNIGNLEFDNGGTLGGTLSGAGTISFANNATYTLSAGTTVGVANLDEYGGSTVLNLGGNFNYAGQFTYNGGYINLGGNTLTLTGADLINGTFDGAGTVSLQGTTTMGPNSAFYFGNQATIINSGVVNQSDTLYIGGTQTAGNDFSVINQGGATWDLTDTYYMANNISSNGETVRFANAGTFTLTGGTGYTLIYATFNNTGTINATAAEIAFERGGVFGGTITGAGLISFQNSTYSLGGLNAAATSSVEFYQSTLNLTGNVSLAGTLLANGSGSIVDLNGHTLSAKMLDFANAGSTQSFDQAGTLSTTGAGSIVDWYVNGTEIVIGGGATWVNSGTMADGGLVQLGDNTLYNGSAAGTLINQAAGVFDLASDDASIRQGQYTSGTGTATNSGAVIINAGTLAKTGGTLTSHLYGTLTSTGTLATTTGTLELDAGGTISGLIADGSTIAFAGGAFSFGALTIGGGSAVSNSVTIDATSTVTLGDASSTAASFTNSGLYRLDTDVGLAAGGTAGSSFINTTTGTLAKIGGMARSVIAAGIANSGTILAGSGTLALTGSITGTGVLDIGAGATLELGAHVAATQAIDYTATTGTLLIDSVAGATQTISGLTVGDAIDLAGITATKAVVNSADKLVISNGTTVVAQLQLAGSYIGDIFTVVSDGNGGSLVTLTKAATAWQGGSADWYTANAWTNGPPDAQTAATIAQAGTYTVTLNNGETGYANTLVLNAASGTYNLSGVLDITTSLTVTAGTLSLGGTLNGGVLASNGGTILFNSDLLDNVSYQGTLNLTNNFETLSTRDSFAIAGAAGKGAGVINLTGYQAFLYAYGYQTLSNATLNFGNSTGGTSYLRSYDSDGQGAILTLGSSLATVQTGTNAYIGDSGGAYDAIYNAGKITAGFSGGTLTIAGNDFENDGTIAVSNGERLILQATSFVNTGTTTIASATFDLFGMLQNTGSITATNSVLNIHSSITGSQLTALASGGDTLNLSGTLDEGNGTLSVGTGAKIVALTLSGEIENATVKPTAGAVSFLNGSILDNVTYLGTIAVGGGVALTLDDTLQGAVIADAGNGVIFGNNVVLSADTYQGTMSLLSGNVVSVTGGLTLQGAGGTGAGAINATAGAAMSVLYFLDNETLSNVTITSGGGTGGELGLFLAPVAPSAGTLTLASSTVFHVLANTEAGFFSVSPTTGQPLGDKIINNGQITIDAGATFLGSDGSLGNITNAGTIALAAGAAWAGAGTPLTSSSFTNTATGLITLGNGASFTTNGGAFNNAGTITLGTGALATIQGNFTETGTATVAAGASFDIFGTMTLASLAGISGAGTLGIDGLLNLAGATFSMGTAGRPSNVQIGGDLKGGTFLNNAGTLTFGTLATLDSMTWRGLLAIGAGSTVDVVNGLTLQTTAGGLPGLLNLTGGATIDYVANTLLDNITVNSTSPSAGVSSPGLADSLDIGIAGGTLTLGANAVLNAKSGALTFADTASGTPNASLINNGQINVTGGALWLDSSFASMTNAGTIALSSNTEFDPTPASTGLSNFTNSGLVTLAGLDDFDVSGNAINAGTITMGPGSAAAFGGAFANSGLVTMSHGDSLTAAGTLTNTGTILANGAASDYISAAPGAMSAFNAGTLTGSGLWEVTASSTLTLDFGSALTTDASDIVLTGANSILRSVGATIARVELTLGTIASTGTLALLASRGYTTTHALTDAGLLQMQGGTFTAGALSISAGGILSGSGTVANAVSNAGTIDAAGGTLTMAAAVTGAGLLKIEAGSELVLGAANAETVLFNSSSSELRLNTPTSFTGTLSGYGAGDSLLLMSTNGTAASISGTSLTVTLSGGGSEIFKLAASHAAQTLTVTSDGHGDTLLTYPAGQVKSAAPAMHFIAPTPAARALFAHDTAHLPVAAVHDWGGSAAAIAAAPSDIFAARDTTAALHGAWIDPLSAHETHSHLMLTGRV